MSGIGRYDKTQRRIEAFQLSGLSDLEVLPGVVTALLRDNSGEPSHMLRITEDGTGGHTFSAHEILFGSFDPATGTPRRKIHGLTLAELVAQDADGPVPDYWFDPAAALLGVQEIAAEAIRDAADEAGKEAGFDAVDLLDKQLQQQLSQAGLPKVEDSYPYFTEAELETIQETVDEASGKAALRKAKQLTSLWQLPADPPDLLDVEVCFSAFKEACLRRAPFCDLMGLGWRADFEGPPGVSFCLAPDRPEQILYSADPRNSEQLYLNGLRTSEHRLERDLLEYFPDDAWARLGARNAANDLLEIQRTAHALMLAQQDESRQEADWDWTGRRYRSFLQSWPLEDPSSWSTSADECLHDACEAIFQRASDYMAVLHPRTASERLPAAL